MSSRKNVVDDCYILGISAFYHDSGASLIKNGEIIGAVQEERFTRIKGDSSLPENSIKYLLNVHNLAPEDLDLVVFYESPFVKMDRLLSTQLLGNIKVLPMFIDSMSKWIPNKLWVERKIKGLLGRKIKVVILDHHLSHGASAFYPSPFEKAAILTIDGVGEWSTTTISKGDGNDITMLKQIEYPNSLGLLYSAFTVLCGFKVNSGEYKLMGLAPYGNPVYKDLILENVLNINQDGSYSLNPTYFDYFEKKKTYNKKFEELFKVDTRKSEDPITQVYCDIAASIQEVTNIAVMSLAKKAKELTSAENLVLAGGVALNVVSVGELERAKIFKKIWVQPAAGDAGGSLGAALWVYYNRFNVNRTVLQGDSMSGAFLGPRPGEVNHSSIETLKQYQLNFDELNDGDLAIFIAKAIKDGLVVGLAKGRMEFGPRALGSRSILADARILDMQKRLNIKTKFREGFRPFAPMVLKEDFDNYFTGENTDSPYMLKTFPVVESIRKSVENSDVSPFVKVQEIRSTIPAVTHIDYSARVQSIDSSRNPFIHAVLTEFKNLTDCSVIINTSFNVRGEPIVCGAEDAVECFINTDIDILVIDNFVVERSKQSTLKSLSSRKFKED